LSILLQKSSSTVKEHQTSNAPFSNCKQDTNIMVEQSTDIQLENQALTDHLRELRSCLIISFIAVIIGFGISYGFIRPIGSWFFKPLTEVLPEGTSLIFTSYQEGFFFI